MSQETVLREILEVYFIVCQEFLESKPLRPVKRLTKQTPQNPDDPIKWTLHIHHENESWSRDVLSFFYGSTAFPANTHNTLVRAYVNRFKCDVAIGSMIRSIATKLREVGARVEWLVVQPKPLLEFFIEDEPNGPFEHSVMSVTASNGRQFIFDPTVEQFGYEGNFCFMPKMEYLDTLTEDGLYQLAPLEEKDDVGAEKLVSMCSNIKWDVLDDESLSAEQRIQKAREMARFAFCFGV